MTPPAPHRHPSRPGEAAIGKYLLAGAAALLIFLAAGSLIALLWDRISDLAKVSIVGAVALALTGTGSVLGLKDAKSQDKRNTVPAATLLGTGGGLGFVALVGAVLLGGLIPPVAALLALCGWAIALILLGALTRMPMTWIIAAIGGITTVGLTASFADREPDQALMGLVATFAYSIALIALTYFSSPSCTSPRSRPWYLLSGLVVIIAALVAARSDVTYRMNASATHLVIIGFVMAAFIQYALISSVVPRDRPEHHGWGAGWLTAPLIVVLAAAKWLAYPSQWHDDEGHWPQFALAGAIIIAVAIVHFLPIERTIKIWASHCLFAAVLVAHVFFFATSADMRVNVAFYAAVITAALLAVRLGHGVHAITMPLAFVWLIDSNRLETWAEFGVFIALGLLTFILTIALDQHARRIREGTAVSADPSSAPAPAPAGAAPPASATAVGPRPVSAVSRASTWILALLVIGIGDGIVNRLFDLNDLTGPWEQILISSITLVCTAVFIVMGLPTNTLTPLEFFTGKGLLKRAAPEDIPVRVRHTVPGASPHDVAYQPMAPGAPAPGAAPMTTVRRTPVAPILVAVFTFLMIPSVAFGQFENTVRDPSVTIGLDLLAVFVVVLGGAVVWMLIPLLRSAVGDILVGGEATIAIAAAVWLATIDIDSSLPINIALILAGAACIGLGFRIGAKHLRLYGLILVIVIVLKFALIDMSGQNSIVRILALLIAGVICFALSVVYSRFSSQAGGAQAGARVCAAPVGPGPVAPAPQAYPTPQAYPGRAPIQQVQPTAAQPILQVPVQTGPWPAPGAPMPPQQAAQPVQQALPEQPEAAGERLSPWDPRVD